MELTKDEVICVAQHLIAQHRQTIFNRMANVGESCETCPIALKCFGKETFVAFTLWHHTYKKISEAAGIKWSFMRNRPPLLPYHKKDNE